MNHDSAVKKVERRGIQRFSITAPVTVILENLKISAFTRDMSNRGMYFFIDSADSAFVGQDFDFLVVLPPDITLSSSCQIRGKGRVVRKEHGLQSLSGAGVAAEILNYSILKVAE